MGLNTDLGKPFDSNALLIKLSQGKEEWNRWVDKHPNATLNLFGLDIVFSLSCAGYRFPSGGFFFYDLYFIADVNFNGAEFMGPVSFNRVTFDGNASFEGACFHQKVSFADIDWQNQINFEQTIFRSYSSFDLSMACSRISPDYPDKNDYSAEDQYYRDNTLRLKNRINLDKSNIKMINVILCFNHKTVFEIKLSLNEKVAYLRHIAERIELLDDGNYHKGITLVYLEKILSIDASLAEEALTDNATVSIILNDALELWRDQPIRWRTFRVSSQSTNYINPPKLVPLRNDRMLIHTQGNDYFELMGASELTADNSPPRFPTGEEDTEVNGSYPGLIRYSIPIPILPNSMIHHVRIIEQTAYIWLIHNKLNFNEQPDHSPHLKLSPLNAQSLSQLNIDIYQADNEHNKMDACKMHSTIGSAFISSARGRIRSTNEQHAQFYPHWASYGFTFTCFEFDSLQDGSYQHKAKWWINTYFSWVIALGEKYLLTESTVTSGDAFYGSMRLVDVHTGHTVRHIPLRTLPLTEAKTINRTYLEPEYQTGMLNGSSQTLYVIYPKCNSKNRQTLISFASPLILPLY